MHVDPRHVIAVNGVRVPLHPTGTMGSSLPACGIGLAAAGVLHPTIKVHSPLVFDVVDTWSGGSIGGAVLRVAPGRAELRYVPGERVRGGGTAVVAVLPVRPHPGAMRVWNRR